jgi:hypothetical protein
VRIGAVEDAFVLAGFPRWLLIIHRGALRGSTPSYDGWYRSASKYQEQSVGYEGAELFIERIESRKPRKIPLAAERKIRESTAKSCHPNSDLTRVISHQ